MFDLRASDYLSVKFVAFCRLLKSIFAKIKEFAYDKFLVSL